ncbi:uncharacterized protein VDAG_00650 [Verticillium dahliae VdLs.17]|uniref:Uncharacterized protein n=1 Tax=Verticillium dahliae (strain VdLs.17 / ATCC MYA-4575 / FGSC 10137) TaxID=498257 RepID=G2WQK8_VERDV|nr:uncharacterized protein VDAG_00650 [Verticillium dahliae VdLs.17]EGY13968.1 hypothetical protein VDAG_00650 [Verticillium dahliae VdLs.17]
MYYCANDGSLNIILSESAPAAMQARCSVMRCMLSVYGNVKVEYSSSSYCSINEASLCSQYDGVSSTPEVNAMLWLTSLGASCADRHGGRLRRAQSIQNETFVCGVASDATCDHGAVLYPIENCDRFEKDGEGGREQDRRIFESSQHSSLVPHACRHRDARTRAPGSLSGGGGLVRCYKTETSTSIRCQRRQSASGRNSVSPAPVP